MCALIITDKLKSYQVAQQEIMPSVEHRQNKPQNNGELHQPTRLREKVMRRFKSARHAQRFLSVFGIITSFFRVGRHLYRASGYREVMKTRFAVWKEAITLSDKDILFWLVKLTIPSGYLAHDSQRLLEDVMDVTVY